MDNDWNTILKLLHQDSKNGEGFNVFSHSHESQPLWHAIDKNLFDTIPYDVTKGRDVFNDTYILQVPTQKIYSYVYIDR